MERIYFWEKVGIEKWREYIFGIYRNMESIKKLEKVGIERH